jgi:WAS family protein 1
MAPSANFHLPVVFENLRDPESLHQLLDSLEALDRVAEEVFGRISKRVQQQRSDLQGIQTRLSAAEVRAPCHTISPAARSCRVELGSV